MGTCVEVCFPVIYAPTEVSDDSYSFLHPICGIHTSYRRHRYFSANEDTSWSASWDLGAIREVSYLYIARADALQSVSSITIESSLDGLSWTLEDTISTPLALSGPDSLDLYYELVNVLSTQYLRVTILYTTLVQTVFSKMYFGTPFNFGRNPSTSSQETRPSKTTTPFRTTSARQIGARTSKPTYNYSLTFEGITDDTTKSFLQKVLYDYNTYVVLLGTDEFLNNQEVLHGYISAPKITRTALDQNKIEFDFVEMTG